MRDMYEVMHNPFDINTHKEVFTNYLEVIILPDGKVEYAVPSHQEKLITIATDKLNVNRDTLCDMCPTDYYFDFMTWLCKISECVAVWTRFTKGELNEKQLDTLKSLHDEGLYLGE